MTAPFDRLWEAARQLVVETPALARFSDWPDAAPFLHRAPAAIPAIPRLMANFKGHGLTDSQARFTEAVKACAHLVEWRRSYSEAEVGNDFLARYGWFELLGPEGHFWSDQHRAYVGYWGRDLYYPWHRHLAEEIYYVAAGSAVFEAEAEPHQVLRPGDTRQHKPDQLHALTTRSEPVLTFVLWRGEGLAGKPAMAQGSAA